MRHATTNETERRQTFIFHQHLFQEWLESMEAELKVSHCYFPPVSHSLPKFQIEYILAHLSEPIRKEYRHHNDPDELLEALRSKYDLKSKPRQQSPVEAESAASNVLVYDGVTD